jgi:hypothetical protein
MNHLYTSKPSNNNVYDPGILNEKPESLLLTQAVGLKVVDDYGISLPLCYVIMENGN